MEQIQQLQFSCTSLAQARGPRSSERDSLALVNPSRLGESSSNGTM